MTKITAKVLDDNVVGPSRVILEQSFEINVRNFCFSVYACVKRLLDVIRVLLIAFSYPLINRLCKLLLIKSK